MSGTCCYCDGACHPDSQSCSACMRQGGNIPSRQPLLRAPSPPPRKSEFGVCYYCGSFCKKENWNCGHRECAAYERDYPAPVPEAETAKMAVEEETDTQYEIEARALEIAITLLEAQIRELKRRRVAVLHKRIALIDI